MSIPVVPDSQWLWDNEPCRAACPVHTDAGAFVTAIAEGRDRDAYLIARAPNPFAASHYLDFAVLMDIADVAGNASDGVHIASAAGAWMALVFGFGGVRDFDGQLTIDPQLPQRFRSLGFSLRFHDRQLRVQLGHEDELYSLDEGDPLEIVIRGVPQRLAIGSPVRVDPRAEDVRP